MSGGVVTQALAERVQTICESEFRRLERKFHPLSPEDRLTTEGIIADVIAAVVVAPARALAADCPVGMLEALVRLFNLDVTAAS
jgi:hypothetical protein